MEHRIDPIDLADRRAARRTAEAEALVAPGLTEAGARELARVVAAQLAALPERERRLLRRKVAVAVHDLESLVVALKAELAGLARDLRAVSSHSGAAGAYGTAARRATPRHGGGE